MIYLIGTNIRNGCPPALPTHPSIFMPLEWENQNFPLFEVGPNIPGCPDGASCLAHNFWKVQNMIYKFYCISFVKMCCFALQPVIIKPNQPSYYALCFETFQNVHRLQPRKNVIRIWYFCFWKLKGCYFKHARAHAIFLKLYLWSTRSQLFLKIMVMRCFLMILQLYCQKSLGGQLWGNSWCAKCSDELFV